MANALNVKIGADIRELERGLQKATSAVRDAGKRMTDLGKTMSLRLTAPLLGVAGMAVKTAADFETLRVSMNTLNGSVEEGARNFERLKKFSAGTPFQLKDLAKAQNMLQGFGMSADDAFESIQMIGDIAAISGGSIEGIGIAFGQASAEGMLMSRDIRQLVNQGVPALQLLADTMGVGKDEIFDLASQGKISFDILQKAFRDATSEGGMFANGMEAQSQTISGKMSTLKDNISIVLAEIGKLIADALAPLSEQVMEFVKGMSQANPATLKMGILIGGLVASIGPLLIVLGALAKSLAFITGLISIKVVAIASIIGALTYVSKNLKAFRDFFVQQFVIIKNQTLLVLAAMIDGLDSFISYLPFVEKPLGGVSAKLLDMISPVPEIKTEFQGLGEFIGSIGQDIGNVFSWLSNRVFPKVGEEGAKAGEKINKPIQSALTSARSFGVAISEVANNIQSPTERIRESLEKVSNGAEFAKGIALDFTSSFGAGMANVVVQGEKLVDVLKNIGKLLLSSAIQKGLSVLLTGGLGGTGFFGSGGGLFGKIFGVNDALITSGGDVVKFHPDDNILAMKDFSGFGGSQEISVRVHGEIRGETIYVSGQRGGVRYGR